MSVSQTRMTVTKMHFVRTRLVRITAHVTQGMKVMESTAQISMNVLLAITLAIMMPPVRTPKARSIVRATMDLQEMGTIVLVSMKFWTKTLQ